MSNETDEALRLAKEAGCQIAIPMVGDELVRFVLDLDLTMLIRLIALARASAAPQNAKPVISSPDKPSIALLAERLHNACYSLGVADERYTSDYQVKKASDKAEAVKAELLAAVAAAIDAAIAAGKGEK